MPKNNGKARREWRKALVTIRTMTSEERLLRAIFGTGVPGAGPKPGTREARP